MSTQHEVQDALHAQRSWSEYRELAARFGVPVRYTRDQWFDDVGLTQRNLVLETLRNGQAWALEDNTQAVVTEAFGAEPVDATKSIDPNWGAF